MTLKKKNCPNIIKIIPIIYIYYYYYYYCLVSIWNRWFNKYVINSHKLKKKYEINSLIYTLSFLVIYPSNCHFSQTLSFFIMYFLTAFTKYSAFWNSTFLLCTFNKTQLFHYALLQKAEPNSPLWTSYGP